MNKEFLEFQEAYDLKELGFNKRCFKNYILVKNVVDDGLVNPNDHELCFSAPIYQQAFRWFRDKHGLKHGIPDHAGVRFYYEITTLNDENFTNNEILEFIRKEKDWDKIEFKSYEEAELACLKKLIEIVKNKKS